MGRQEVLYMYYECVFAALVFHMQSACAILYFYLWAV
jgi:hypothetical protein